MSAPLPTPGPTARLRPWALLALLAGCGTTALDVFETCTVQATLDPAQGAPGTIVTVQGGPFSELRDTRVELGGTPATVLSIAQTDGIEDRAADCEACDLCREEASCGPCGSCPGRGMEPDRRRECFGDDTEETPAPGFCDRCVEQMQLEIPAHPSGPTHLWFVNRFGTSELVPFTVLVGDTATSDTAASDTATSDTATSGGSGATSR